MIKQLASLLRPHRTAGAAVVATGVLASLMEGLGIGLFIPFIQALDSAGSSATSGSEFVQAVTRLFSAVSEERRLIVISLAIFTVLLAKGLLTFANAFYFARVSTRAGHELRTRVFDAALFADIGRIDRFGVGRLTHALTTASWQSADAMTCLLQAIISAGTLAVFVVLLLLISWKMTLVVASLLILLSLAIRLMTRHVGWFGRKMTEANTDVAGRMIEGVDGMEVIRGYGQEARESERFAKLSKQLATISLRKETISGAVYPVYEILAAGLVVAVLFTSAQSGTDIASLLVFVFILFRLVPVVKRLETERVELGASAAAVDEIYLIVTDWDAQSAPIQGGQIAGLQHGLTLEALTYRYDDAAPLALDRVTTEIPAKGLTALVGPSGAGKSTLVKLILRFYEPSDGRILADSVPLTDIDSVSWRAGLAVVPQKPFLFNATIRNNIAYGNLDATDEEIITAARAAGACEFIEALADGYNTMLGAEGVALSGGEAQRICLARAIVRKPALLLLDEATNALDSISEAHIQSAVAALSANCAVLVVAHRLATVEQADKIIVLDRGNLVEQGDFESLLAADGLFARLWRREPRDESGP